MEPERASFHFRVYEEDSFFEKSWTERRNENKLSENLLFELKDSVERSVEKSPILILDESTSHQCCQYFLPVSGKFVQVQAVYPWRYTEKLTHRLGLSPKQIKDHKYLRLQHAKGLIDEQGNQTELGAKIETEKQAKKSQAILNSTARRKQISIDRLKCLCNNPGDRKAQDKARDKADPNWRFTPKAVKDKEIERRLAVTLSDLAYWKRVDMNCKQ